MKSVKKYVIWAYLVFWFSVLGLCGTASMVFGAGPFLMRVLSNVCAWTPTIVLLAGFSKFEPQQNRIGFVKDCFSGKIKPVLLIVPALTVAGLTVISVALTGFVMGRSFAGFWQPGPWSFAASLLFSVTTGPTGEELGWRGYMRPKLNARYGFVRGSVIQGVIWAFWHTVLWFVDSDFLGPQLIPYIVSNVVVMTALSFLMNYVLEKQKNLVYAFMIHFSFNFLYCFLSVDIWFYVVLTLVYAVMGGVVIFLYRNGQRK